MYIEHRHLGCNRIKVSSEEMRHQPGQQEQPGSYKIGSVCLWKMTVLRIWFWAVPKTKYKWESEWGQQFLAHRKEVLSSTC